MKFQEQLNHAIVSLGAMMHSDELSKKERRQVASTILMLGKYRN